MCDYINMTSTIDEIIADTYYTAHLIKKRIDQIDRKPFPSETAPNLLGTLKDICSFSQKTLADYRRDFEFTPKESIRIVKFISFFLRCVIAPDIRFAEGASIEKTPGAFVRALENLVESEQLLKNSTLIVRPQWYYNFKIFELRKYYENSLIGFMDSSLVGELFSAFEEYIYVISFPGFQKTNLLIQLALGHELGHPLAEEFINQENEDYKYDIEEAIETEYAEKWSALSEGKRVQEKAAKMDQIVSLRNRFLSEIISDLVESHLFNLATLFSMVTFICPMPDIDEPVLDPNNSYPAWRTRLRFVYEDLKEQDLSSLDLGYNDENIDICFSKRIADSIKDNLDKIKSMTNVKNDIVILTSHPETRIAYNHIVNPTTIVINNYT